MDSHAKSSTISRVYRCCCNLFRQNPLRFPSFCFGMCLFPKENQQPVLGGNRFSEEKLQFSLDVKQKYTFFQRKSTKKIAKVSPSYNNYSFRIIQKFNNHNTQNSPHTKNTTTLNNTRHPKTHNTQHSTTHNTQQHSTLKNAQHSTTHSNQQHTTHSTQHTTHQTHHTTSNNQHTTHNPQHRTQTKQ